MLACFSCSNNFLFCLESDWWDHKWVKWNIIFQLAGKYRFVQYNCFNWTYLISNWSCSKMVFVCLEVFWYTLSGELCIGLGIFSSFNLFYFFKFPILTGKIIKKGGKTDLIQYLLMYIFYQKLPIFASPSYFQTIKVSFSLYIGLQICLDLCEPKTQLH